MTLRKPCFLFILGTRPETIKLAPLVKEFQRRSDIEVKVCITGQHRQLVDQILDLFNIIPDFDLSIMRPNQSLFQLTADGLIALEEVIEQCKPNLIFVQGDTTTSFIGALAGYYRKIKVAHIEAGLRTGDRHSPFPEEMNRLLVDQLSDYHFTPTIQSARNLEEENIREHVYHVGNTIIDALYMGLDFLKEKGYQDIEKKFPGIRLDKKIVLITGHRRESFGKPFENLCHAIHEVAERFTEVEFVYPVHLNPNVQTPVKRILGGIKNIHLLEPLEYPNFIWLMHKASVILTDSGGVQEEAHTLGKPLLVMRNETERREAIESGTAMLVGTNTKVIVNALVSLLEDKSVYLRMAKAGLPYGDGTACKKIADTILQILNIVPLHSSEELEDFPYGTIPFKVSGLN